ncbi:MAG TPA: hypothetical protein VGZ25_14175 [Gemmataceae bacterium]|nr:hypothetical protein [Gemmataceae bacterium]
MVSLHGTLTDTDPSTTWVSLGGKVQGSVEADASGNFSTTLAASAVGVVTALATDNAGLTSNQASATIVVAPPQITLTLTYGTGHQLILSGTVTDNYPGGLKVNITGVVPPSTATTDASGNFNITLSAYRLGDVTATTTDSWGQVSNTAKVTATNTAPVISNLWATAGNYDTWTITGKVTDEHAAGLTVTFWGLPAVAGKTAIVQADGTFTLSVVIPSNQSGYIYAQTTDWWGAASNIDEEMITQLVGGGNPTGH